MEIKDQKIIDTLAKTLGVPKENLSGVKILSAEEQVKEINKNVALLINSFFKENFLKRIDDEMNKTAKLKDSSTHLLLTLSDLRQKCLAIEEDSQELGRLFGLAEQLGAVGYAIFVATELD